MIRRTQSEYLETVREIITFVGSILIALAWS